MNQNFTPPQMPNVPQGAQNAPNTPNMPQGPESQEQKKWQSSITRSTKIRQAANTIIQTRSQFKDYLQEHGLDLETSAIEFQQTGDFIASSYIIYPAYGYYRESLKSFIQRYPQLQEPVIAIRDSLRPVQSNMQVLTHTSEDN
jgi:hypothetical protein